VSFVFFAVGGKMLVPPRQTLVFERPDLVTWRQVTRQSAL
jgi:hypothetical protein